MAEPDIHPAVTRITAPMSMGVPRRPGGGVDLYLIRGEQNALIDTGVYNSPENAIEPALAELGLGLKDIDFVLHTHGHADHTGGNAAFQARSEARFFLSGNELPVLKGDSQPTRAEFYGPLREVFGDEQFQAKLDDHILNCGESFRLDELVDDGDVIDLGGDTRLRVVSLPGHTPGCVGYYWEREGILFAGDSIGGRGGRVGGMPIIYDTEA